ncbi:hypothetical protein MMC34_002569 [Xylographa carneopallida]|nr:hypothetical protein [Xylographa carneopallida]
MEQSEVYFESHQGTASRRGKQLAPILTSFDSSPPTRLPRPRPIETIIYERAPTIPTSVPTSSPLQHRISRGGLRSLFSRTKSAKVVKREEQLQNTIEEDDTPTSPVLKVAVSSVGSVRNGRSSFTQESSSTSTRVVTPVSRQRPHFEPVPVTHPAEQSDSKERPIQSLKTWNPPPLFQAYPQAVKHSNLPAPTSSVDAILRMEKQRRSNEKKQGHLQSTAETSLEQSEEGDNPHEGILPKGHRSRKSAGSHLEWTSKVFVLATSGFLLQYTGDGNFDRLPEKILQLGKDSAAFASDVILGKRWVLQILQASDETGATTNSISVLSRLGFRSEKKRLVSSFLLVLDSPEEMNSWLVAVRKEIETLGGKRYRPDVGIRKTTDEVIRQLRDKPSRRYLVKRDPNQFSNQRAPQSFPRNVSYPEVTEEFVSSEYSEQDTLQMDRQISLRQAQSVTSRALVPEGMLADALRESSRSSYASTGTKTSATPFPTSPVPSPLKSDFMGDTLRAEHSGLFPDTAPENAHRRSFQSNVPRANEGRPSFDIKLSNPTPRPLSTTSSSTYCSASPVTTNFSVPNFSKRAMQPGHPSQLPTPPASAGTMHRSPSPSPLDALPERPDSVLGELPMLRTSPSVSRSRVNLKQDSPSTISNSITSDLNALPKVPITFHSHADRPVPRRFSSLEYSAGKLPPSISRHNPSPHPPPTSALPALPPPDISSVNTSLRHTTATSTPFHKLRRPASMQVHNSPLPQLRSSSSQARMHSIISSDRQPSSNQTTPSTFPTPDLTPPQKGGFANVPVVKISESSPKMRGRGWAEYGGIELGTRGVKVS